MKTKQIEVIKTLSDMLYDKTAKFEKYKKEHKEWEGRRNEWNIKNDCLCSWKYENETKDYRPVCDVSEAEIERIVVQLRKELVRLYGKQRC